MGLLTGIVVVVYLLLVGYLGYRGYRQTKTAADYLVAGRSAHPLVMALSYGATFISTSAIVGFGGVAANLGMGLLWLTFLNIFVGIFIAFVALGGPTRRMGRHIDAHTFPELLGKRFDSKFIQVFAGLVVFLLMPLYTMAVINGAAEFIKSTFHIPFEPALYVFAVVVAAYVIIGGLKGVMLTDALQGTIMLVGMVVLFVATYAILGGVTSAHEALSAMEAPKSLVALGHQGWTSMPKFGWAKAGAEPAEAMQYSLWWTMVSTIVMGVGIGVLAQPQLIVRFMTVKSKQALNRGVAMGGIFIFFMTGVAFIVGAVSNVYFAQKEEILCRVLDENALLVEDPGTKVLVPIAPEATEEARHAGKRFVSYRLPGEGPEQAPHYVLHTPTMKVTRGGEGEWDRVAPGLISIARTIGPGTTMKGIVDGIIPIYITSALPRWFGVLFLLTLLSAAMSTVSSQFHAMGTAIGRDVFEQATHRHSHRSVLITRLGIGFGIVVAIALGKVVHGNVIALATAIFFGLCGASFLPAFVGGLFSKRMSRTAAIASILTGFFGSLFWLVFMNDKTASGLGISLALFGRSNLVPKACSATWTVVDPLFVALPLSAIVAIVVTLTTKPMNAEHARYCFGGPKPTGTRA
ncbi:MAG: sodium:solute symporter family protein [Planctomycetota bacterium]